MKPAEFIRMLNNDLGTLERILETEEDERFLNIFILGLPRSGTTLLTQVIFNNLDVMCTNNVIAKFWKTPLVGAYLSKITLGSQKSDSYCSVYAKTKYPWDPHEFSWFWNDLMNIKDITKYNITEEANRIDWERVRTKLVNLNKVLEAPMVHKPLELIGYHLEKFASLFEKALFIYIDRDALDVAYSLTEARLYRYSDISVWWGSYPPIKNYSTIADQPYNIQIAIQVHCLKKMYFKKIPILPATKVLTTSYDSLCEKPDALLNEIVLKANKLDCEVTLLNVPTKFTPSKKERDPNILKALKDGFSAIEGGRYE
jgi:hypothetical protein